MSLAPKPLLIRLAFAGLVASLLLAGCNNNQEPAPVAPADAPRGGSPPTSSTGGVNVDPRPTQPTR